MFNLLTVLFFSLEILVSILLKPREEELNLTKDIFARYGVRNDGAEWYKDSFF